MDNIDWNNLDQVKLYCDTLNKCAKTFASRSIVIKHKDRDNYNITHISRFIALAVDHPDTIIVYQ